MGGAEEGACAARAEIGGHEEEEWEGCWWDEVDGCEN